MTGTGTQTDPYIVDNWDDLMSVISHIGVYIELDANSENKTIDMSKISPSGIGDIECGFRVLNGNGWTIKNIYCPYSCLFKNNPNIKAVVSFENLNICNIYKSNGVQSIFNSLFISLNKNYNLYIKNCKISCVIQDESTDTLPTSFSKCTNIYNSSINMDIRSSYSTLFSKYIGTTNTLNNCNINIVAKNNSRIDYIFAYSSVHNTKISGIIENILNFYVNTSNPTYWVLDVKTDYSGTLKAQKNSKGLINADKAPNIVAGDNMVLVTSEELSNFEYLKSVGFPVSETTGWIIQDGEIKTDKMPNIELLGAFANNTKLTKVAIPSSVTLIGDTAFKNTALSSVKIAENCTYGDESFPKDCKIDFYKE